MKKLLGKLFNIKQQFKNNKIYFFAKIAFCIIIAFSIMLDSMLIFEGNIAGKLSENYFKSISTFNILVLILVFLALYFVITLVELLIDKIENKISWNKNSERKSKKVFFITFIIILVLWLPYVLSFFPGGVFADTIVSINEALGKTRLYNHNPILHTLILKLFLNIGMLISNNNGQLIGLGIYTVAQIIFMDAVISYFIYWTYNKGLSKKYIILEILFFGLFKLFPLYALSIWKDTVFSLVLLLYIISLADIVYERGENLKKITGIIKYLLLMTLVIFLRNNGIYIVLFTTLVLFFVFRKDLLHQLKKFSIATIITITICYTIQGPIFNMLGMNTEFIENLGMFLQQISYVVSKDGNITEEQKNYINNILPIEDIKATYSPCVVDTIKWNENFNAQCIDENKGEFFKVWFQLFLQNPVSYCKAYLLNSIGFWDIKQSNSNSYTNHTMWPTIKDLAEYKQSDYIEILTNKSIRNILEPHIFISSAMFFAIILIGVLITIYRKKYTNLLIYCPIIATWITIMIAVPVAFSLRYVYIFVLALPLSILVPFLGTKQEKTKQIEGEKK